MARHNVVKAGEFVQKHGSTLSPHTVLELRQFPNMDEAWGCLSAPALLNIIKAIGYKNHLPALISYAFATLRACRDRVSPLGVPLTRHISDLSRHAEHTLNGTGGCDGNWLNDQNHNGYSAIAKLVASKGRDKVCVSAYQTYLMSRPAFHGWLDICNHVNTFATVVDHYKGLELSDAFLRDCIGNPFAFSVQTE